jgi:hypothetical protein
MDFATRGRGNGVCAPAAFAGVTARLSRPEHPSWNHLALIDSKTARRFYDKQDKEDCPPFQTE